MPVLDCGIDIGSTNLKVVFAGHDGSVIYNRTVPSPRVTDGVGLATDAMVLVAVLEDLIIEGWLEHGGGTPLRSIAAAGVGEDGVGITSDLMPTGYAIPWFDKRALSEVEILKGHSHLNARAGIGANTERTAAKWLWLHRHRPDELSAAKHWIALTDFPAVWWSGKPFISQSLAPRTGCYDIYKRQWIEELLAISCAPKLPRILNAGDIVGGARKTRLRDSGAISADTLLVAGGHDHPVAAAMIKRFDAKARVDSLGTANLVYGETPIFEAQHVREGLAFSIPPSGREGISCLGVLELSEAFKSLRESAVDFESCMAASRMPGLPPVLLVELHKADHQTRVRRGLEQTCYQAQRLLDAMDDVGVTKGPIYATGGWSRSHAFVELRASIFAEPIHVVGDLELTALGAACFGAEAATTKTICPFRRNDISCVEPVDDWVAEYEQIYSALTSSS